MGDAMIVRVLLLAAAVLHSPMALAQAGVPASDQGTIAGQLIDPAGAPVAGAVILLNREPDGVRLGMTTSGSDGRFVFPDVAAGRFRISVSAPGFASSTQFGELVAGSTISLAPIALTLSAGTIGVDVRPDRVIAEEQLKTQETQRVFGVFQNFNVSYDPHAVPLDARQKFQLTWKSVFDPVQFGTRALVAGVQQAHGDYSGFGGGGEGYAKRYAALTATTLTGAVLSKGVLPVLLKQDPRYFYKGSGSTSSRIGYALSRAVVRKGDNGRVRPDYSRVLGHLVAGAISNLYYPPENRHGLQLTVTNTVLAVGGAGVDNLLQEFVLKHFTTHAP